MLPVYSFLKGHTTQILSIWVIGITISLTVLYTILQIVGHKNQQISGQFWSMMITSITTSAASEKRSGEFWVKSLQSFLNIVGTVRVSKVFS